MDCEHSFDIKERRLHGGSAKNTVHGAILSGGLEVDWKTKDGFCIKCGAWKGQLGLEPTFNLYIEHLCDIFDEIKRVLRDDGTIWINLGDTYGGSGSGQKYDSFSKGKEKSEEQYRTKWYQGKRPTTGMTYASKCLVMIPERFAIEMINRGWILRNIIIWYKPGCMPSSAKDRFTVDFEYLFFFSKSKEYYFEQQFELWTDKNIHDIKRAGKFIKYGGKWTDDKSNRSVVVGDPKQGRNVRCVWTINPKPFSDYICDGCGYYGKAKLKKEKKGYFGGEDKDKRPCPQCGKKINISHFAIYPEELCETPIKAGCPDGGIVLDPFFGAGTTGIVALKQNKKIIGIELNKGYIEIAKERLKPLLEQEELS